MNNSDDNEINNKNIEDKTKVIETTETTINKAAFNKVWESQNLKERKIISTKYGFKENGTWGIVDQERIDEDGDIIHYREG